MFSSHLFISRIRHSVSHIVALYRNTTHLSSIHTVAKGKHCQFFSMSSQIHEKMFFLLLLFTSQVSVSFGVRDHWLVGTDKVQWGADQSLVFCPKAQTWSQLDTRGGQCSSQAIHISCYHFTCYCVTNMVTQTNCFHFEMIFSAVKERSSALRPDDVETRVDFIVSAKETECVWLTLSTLEQAAWQTWRIF